MTADMPARKPKILVVDDDPAQIREIYQALGRDHQVFQAMAADRALALAATMMPDLVLVDIALGPTDGYDLAAALRSDAATRRVGLAFLAEAGDDRARGIGLGALGFLSKPLDRDRLLQAVGLWLAHGQMADAGSAGAARHDALDRVAAVRGVDLAAGLRNVGGSRDLYLSVLRSLCVNHAGIGAELATALSIGDRAAATLLAHTAKTLCRTIGAADLGEVAFAIEFALKSDSGQIRGAMPSADDFRRRFDRIVQDIAQAISTGDSQP